MRGKTYDIKEENFIRNNYGAMTCQEIAKKLGRPLLSVYVFANRKGISKVEGKGRFWNKTVWTQEKIQFLKENFFTTTNVRLAQGLNLTLTVVRNKCAELGLKRMDLEYWTEEMEEFLRAHYEVNGDVEIAEAMQVLFPKKKGWKKQHICQKRKYLSLRRTRQQIDAIRKKNSSEGGNAFTISKNSSSVNASPTWVAQQIAWRNKPLQQEVLKRPELIELKRQSILLNRLIKNGTPKRNATT